MESGWWGAAILAGAALLAVTSDSFWIDEFVIVGFSTTRSLADTWRWLQTLHLHEIQMPFYIAYMWAWVHLFGPHEWVMRAANIPWFVAGASVFSIYIGRMLRSVLLASVLCAFAPLAWYYLNDARVYAIELGFALAATAAAAEVARTVRAGEPSGTPLRILAFSFVALAGTSVLGAVWGGVAVLAIFLFIPVARWSSVAKAAPAACLAAGVLLVALLVYYDWTRSLDLHATAVGTTTPATIGFVFYELFGWSGIGPGRGDLRAAPGAIVKAHAPALVPFACLTILALAIALRRLARDWSWRRLLLATGLIVGPALGLFAIGMATRFRVLGRHVIPLLPYVLGLLSLGIREAWRRNWPWRGAAALFLVFWLASAFSIRFAGRHKKDDYRTAAAIARREAESGRVVWWNAEAAGAVYYRVPLTVTYTNRGVFPLLNPLPEMITQVPPADVIIQSKPDTYDSFLGVAGYLRDHPYRATSNFSTFTVWVRSPGPQR